MGTMARYTNEMSQRAVRMVAGLLGMNAETLWLWVHRPEVDASKLPGTTTEGAERIKRFKRGVAELRRAHVILKSASVFNA